MTPEMQPTAANNPAPPVRQPITGPQLKKLQTLWGIAWSGGTISLTSDEIPSGTFDSRVARICFVKRVVKRPIESTKDLSRAEAELVISTLAKSVPERFNTKKKKLGRKHAQELGTAGRKGAAGAPRMAGPAELGHITFLLQKLGWTQERFDGWLRSVHSPLAPRSEIRTLADANRVRWALKGILKSQQKKEAAGAI